MATSYRKCIGFILLMTIDDPGNNISITLYHADKVVNVYIQVILLHIYHNYEYKIKQMNYGDEIFKKRLYF